jgi:hypothetical protein
MFVDLLVGHDFTENPSVLIIKTQKQLTITQLMTATNELSNATAEKFAINQVIEDNQLSLDRIKFGDITPEQQNTLFNLLQQFRSRFCFSLQEIGCTKSAEMKIDTKTDKPIVYRFITFGSRNSQGCDN